jgi:dTDP-4-dehydrorhamnose 3,5-epimerase
VQDNISFSQKGVLRGLHYQSSPGQGKLVSVLVGKIWDVAVDIRKGSATFGQWEAVELSSDNHYQFYIPVGFAHGYCVLSETALVQYKVTAEFNPATERTIRWDDPDLTVEWPLQHPVLSDRDQKARPFCEMALT